MHVGSRTSASMPNARAERAISPRFSGIVEPFQHGDRGATVPTTSATLGSGRRCAEAITPRWKSNPTVPATTPRRRRGSASVDAGQCLDASAVLGRDEDRTDLVGDSISR